MTGRWNVSYFVDNGHYHTEHTQIERFSPCRFVFRLEVAGVARLSES